MVTLEKVFHINIHNWLHIALDLNHLQSRSKIQEVLFNIGLHVKLHNISSSELFFDKQA